MPPAQESRASPFICHRPNGHGRKNESSAQTSAPSGRQTTSAVISDGDRPTSHPQTRQQVARHHHDRARQQEVQPGHRDAPKSQQPTQCQQRRQICQPIHSQIVGQHIRQTPSDAGDCVDQHAAHQAQCNIRPLQSIPPLPTPRPDSPPSPPGRPPRSPPLSRTSPGPPAHSECRHTAPPRRPGRPPTGTVPPPRPPPPRTPAPARSQMSLQTPAGRSLDRLGWTLRKS